MAMAGNPQDKKESKALQEKPQRVNGSKYDSCLPQD